VEYVLKIRNCLACRVIVCISFFCVSCQRKREIEGTEGIRDTTALQASVVHAKRFLVNLTFFIQKEWQENRPNYRYKRQGKEETERHMLPTPPQ
jgi:hypothetical protein